MRRNFFDATDLTAYSPIGHKLEVEREGDEIDLSGEGNRTKTFSLKECLEKAGIANEEQVTEVPCDPVALATVMQQVAALEQQLSNAQADLAAVSAAVSHWVEAQEEVEYAQALFEIAQANLAEAEQSGLIVQTPGGAIRFTESEQIEEENARTRLESAQAELGAAEANVTEADKAIYN